MILINTKINIKIENTGTKNTRRTRRRTEKSPSIATVNIKILKRNTKRRRNQTQRWKFRKA